MIKINTISIDLSKNYDSYFMGYIKTLNLKDGDKIKSNEYMSWITNKHRNFRKKIGINEFVPYTEKQKKEFLKFISAARSAEVDSKYEVLKI